MALYPDIQRKAQEELDRVTLNNRLPEHSDKAECPLIVSEVCVLALNTG
jgi:hypothetical protein